jgi:hypothetical protein
MEKNMTDDEQRAAIREHIRKNTEANTVSKEIARKSLIDRGFYTEDGKLRPEFGGDHTQSKKAKSAA